VPEINVTLEDGDYSVRAGYGKTEKGALANSQGDSRKIAVSGAWKTENTFVMKVFFYETPQSARHTFRFEEKKLSWNTENRASFGPRTLPVMEGVHR